MKTKAFLLVAALFFALNLAGCGDNHHEPSPIVTDIVSEGGTLDGDITFDGVNYSVFTSDQSPNTVLVNFGTGTESRGFITFSLATVPVTASIQRATVFLPIFRVSPSTVVLFPDMVTFPPLDTLTNQSAMASVFDLLDDTVVLRGPSFDVTSENVGLDATFDATDAVIEANVRALSTLQIRLISAGGEVEIDDLFVPQTGAGTPLLRVEYF